MERREFLQKAGLASAATGMVWAAPSVLGASTAFAAGSCVNNASLDWDSSTARLMPAPSTSGTVTGYAVIPASGTSPAIRVNMSVARVGTPGTGSGVYNGVLNQTNGGIPGRQYFIGMANNASGEGYVMTFTFRNSADTAPVNVYNLKFTVADIDRSGASSPGYQDTVSVLPAPTSYVKYSANVTASGTPVDTFTATGGSNVDPSNDYGNVDLTYAGPINQVQVKFLSGTPYGNIQSISISDLTWCY